MKKRMIALTVVLVVALALGALLVSVANAGRGPEVECTEYLGTGGEFSYYGAHDNTRVTACTLGTQLNCPSGTEGYIQYVECVYDKTRPDHSWLCRVRSECYEIIPEPNLANTVNRGEWVWFSVHNIPQGGFARLYWLDELERPNPTEIVLEGLNGRADFYVERGGRFVAELLELDGACAGWFPAR